MSTPSQPLQMQQAAPEQDAASSQAAAPAQDDSSNLPDEQSDEQSAAGAGVNLQRAYSKVNQAVTALFDGLGVRRSATIAHVDGQSPADHINAIGQVLPTIGGLTKNFLTATHTKHDSTGGATVAHPSDKLRSTVVPKDFEAAKSAVSATKSFVSSAAKLIGKDNPAVQLATAQLALIGKHDMAGMSAYDAGAALMSVPTPLIQMIAQKHSEMKHGGEIHARRTAPQEPPTPQGEAQGGDEASEDQSAASAAPTAAAAAPAPSAGAPAAPAQ